jgi:hypothetical protein
MRENTNEWSRYERCARILLSTPTSMQKAQEVLEFAMRNGATDAIFSFFSPDALLPSSASPADDAAREEDPEWTPEQSSVHLDASEDSELEVSENFIHVLF